MYAYAFGLLVFGASLTSDRLKYPPMQRIGGYFKVNYLLYTRISGTTGV